MAFITVTGKILDPSGTIPTSGTITATLSGYLIDNPEENLIVAKAETAAVSAVDGTFSIVLESTLDGTPNTRTYDFVFTGVVEGATVTQPFGPFALAPTPSSVTLADLIQAGLVQATAVYPLISGADVFLTLKETDQTLPLGLWRMRISGDVLGLEKNTAAAGDFSTLTELYRFTGSLMTLNVPLAATLSVPTIADFSNATHGHTSAATGGTLNASAIAAGIVAPARLGSGTPDGTKVLWGDGVWAVISGGGDALVANPLSQFAATTSAQLLGVMSDETGTGLLVFNSSPTIVTPTIASFANAGHSHQDAAGGATLAEAALALTDIATNDASTSKHGFLKKLSNIATEFMNGQGAWATPSAAGMQYSDARFELVSATKDLSDATTTQAITGVTFTPKGVFVIAAIGGTNTTCWGFAENVDTAETFNIHGSGDAATFTPSTSFLVLYSSLAGNAKQVGVINSWDVDTGITIGWTKSASPTGTATMYFFFFR